jgi:tryptophanase
MIQFDPTCFDALSRLLARPDPGDLPRRAHVLRCAGDPDRRATRLPSILMGWLQQRWVDELDGEDQTALGVPVFKPAGGHAIYLDAAAFLPHVPAREYPGQALACALYLEGGIRACEIGSVMFGRDDPGTGEFQPARLEMVRLAIPRRVYTQSHMDYVVECVGEMFARRDAIRGVRIAWEPPILRHFTARFEPLG